MITIGVVVVIVLAIVIFAAVKSAGKTDNNSEGLNDDGTKSISDTNKLSEKEKYIMFEAEMTCNLGKSDSGEDIVNAMKDTEPLMEKYGYSNDDYQRLRSKYSADSNLPNLIIDKMDDICPDIVKKMGM